MLEAALPAAPASAPALATALLALWNGVTPELDADYNAWHAQEHVPERLTVPGILWARRYGAVWTQAGPRYLTLYGLRDAEVLQGDAYQHLLRSPTPMSARMRPHLSHLSRWVCALRTAQPVPAGDGLRVRTCEAEPAGDAGLGSHEEVEGRAAPVAAVASTSSMGLAGPAWLARRLPDAAPLPWLQGGQEHAVQGDWLIAQPLAQAPNHAEPGAMVYAALPCGPAKPA